MLPLAAMGILCPSMFNNSWYTCTDTSGKGTRGQGAVKDCNVILLRTGNLMYVQHKPVANRSLCKWECNLPSASLFSLQLQLSNTAAITCLA